MFENPRTGRQVRNIYKKCFENSRSQIVFQTDILRKLTLGAPVGFSLIEFLKVMKIMMDKEESFDNCSNLVFPSGFLVAAFLSKKFKVC